MHHASDIIAQTIEARIAAGLGLAVYGVPGRPVNAGPFTYYARNIAERDVVRAKFEAQGCCVEPIK